MAHTCTGDSEVRIEDFDIGIDACHVQSRLFLPQIREQQWVILFQVNSAEHSRFINPTDAIMGLACRDRGITCPHRDKFGSGFATTALEHDKSEARVYSFDELLGLWVGRGRTGGNSESGNDNDTDGEDSDENH